jgi:hypothetical protein
MENKEEKKLKAVINKPVNLSTQVKPKLVLKPKPIAQKVKEALLTLRDKALNTINTVLDYTLNNFTEMYNSATNGTNSNINSTNNNGQQRVALNEQAVTQELIAKAKYDGDSKEVILNNKGPNSQTMVGSSLVIDMDAKKIEATIQEMDKRLNPSTLINDIKPKEDKVSQQENKQENSKSIKPEPKNKKEKKNDKKPSSEYQSPKPTPKPKLKPETPKPVPQNKKEPKIEVPKPPIPTINIQANVEAMRNKFLKNQEEHPHILEEQQFQTVLKPQDPIFKIRDKKTVIGSMSAIRKNLLPQQVPDTVENIHGVEQVKIKSKLK